MKLTCLKAELSHGLSLASRIVMTNPTLPILGNVYLEAKKGALLLSTTNLELGIELTISSKVDKTGAVTVPAKPFSDLISSLPDESVSLSLQDNSLHIQTASFSSTLHGTSPEDFPRVIPPKEGMTLQFQPEALEKALKRVIFAAADDSGRPVLGGVLLKTQKQQVEWVATDGFRLSRQEMRLPSTVAETVSIIPAKALAEVVRLLAEPMLSSQKNWTSKKESKTAKKSAKSEQNIEILISSKLNQLFVRGGDLLFVSRLIEGQFPAYEQIIPSASVARAVLDREEFLQAMRISEIYARRSAQMIKLELGEKSGISVHAVTKDMGESRMKIDAKVEAQEDLTIAFNVRYLLDLLQAITSKDIELLCAGSVAPVVLKDPKDPEFLHVIMPIRIEG